MTGDLLLYQAFYKLSQDFCFCQLDFSFPERNGLHVSLCCFFICYNMCSSDRHEFRAMLSIYYLSLCRGSIDPESISQHKVMIYFLPKVCTVV